MITKNETLKTSTRTIKYRQTSLNMEMHGIQTMLALFFNKLFELQCETLVNELLHDTSNRIKISSKSYHIKKPKEHESSVQNIISESLNGKEGRNSTDHRKPFTCHTLVYWEPCQPGCSRNSQVVMWNTGNTIHAWLYLPWLYHVYFWQHLSMQMLL